MSALPLLTVLVALSVSTRLKAKDFSANVLLVSLEMADAVEMVVSVSYQQLK